MVGSKLKRVLSILGILLFLYHCRSAMSPVLLPETKRLPEAASEQSPQEKSLADRAPVSAADRTLWNTFDFAEPELDSRPFRARARQYHLPTYSTSRQHPHAIRGVNERSLVENEGLTLGDWCRLLQQSSARIVTSTGSNINISVAGLAPEYASLSGNKNAEVHPCATQASSETARQNFSDPSYRESRYEISSAVFAQAARSEELIPFRSVAVDPTLIPYGTLIYVPTLRGKSFVANGRSFTHDGYFLAVDSGPQLLENNIAFFSGFSNQDHFGFSQEEDLEIFFLANREVSQTLRDLHRYFR